MPQDTPTPKKPSRAPLLVAYRSPFPLPSRGPPHGSPGAGTPLPAPGLASGTPPSLLLPPPCRPHIDTQRDPQNSLLPSPPNRPPAVLPHRGPPLLRPSRPPNTGVPLHPPPPTPSHAPTPLTRRLGPPPRSRRCSRRAAPPPPISPAPASAPPLRGCSRPSRRGHTKWPTRKQLREAAAEGYYHSNKRVPRRCRRRKGGLDFPTLGRRGYEAALGNFSFFSPALCPPRGLEEGGEQRGSP